MLIPIITLLCLLVMIPIIIIVIIIIASVFWCFTTRRIYMAIIIQVAMFLCMNTAGNDDDVQIKCNSRDACLALICMFLRLVLLSIKYMHTYILYILNNMRIANIIPNVIWLWLWILWSFVFRCGAALYVWMWRLRSPYPLATIMEICRELAYNMWYETKRVNDENTTIIFTA